eukprot:scaffold87969_cov31-Tisochrysis_lutea.AAC.1
MSPRARATQTREVRERVFPRSCITQAAHPMDVGGRRARRSTPCMHSAPRFAKNHALRTCRAAMCTARRGTP